MNNIIKITIWVLFMAMVTDMHSIAFSEKTVSFAFSNYEPYTGQNLPDNGFIVDIVNEAFSRIGYKTQFSYRPWTRVLEEVKTGIVQAAPAVYYTNERAEFMVFSKPIWTVRIIFISLKDRNIHFSRISDLKSYIIGVERGSVIEDYMAAENLKTEAVTSLTQNIKKLLFRRVDMIIEPKDVILYYLNHNFEQADRDQIRFYSPPYKEDTLHVAFSKKTDDYQTLISKFNRGLQLIKSDGTYDNIIMKHGMNSD